MAHISSFHLFFFTDTATTEIYTLSLHDALPICAARGLCRRRDLARRHRGLGQPLADSVQEPRPRGTGRIRAARCEDRKSTRLNSSHSQISYAVFCLKKKKKSKKSQSRTETHVAI